MKRNKGLLVFLAVVGVSVSGPMVKWSLACGASPVMIAFGRMLISAALLLVPALRSGELVAVLRAPKKQLALTCAAALLLALHYTAWMTSMSFASTFVSTALVCTQPLFVAALSGILLHEPIKREAIPGAIVAVIGAAAIGLLSMSGEHGSLLGDDCAGADAGSVHGILNGHIVVPGLHLHIDPVHIVSIRAVQIPLAVFRGQDKEEHIRFLRKVHPEAALQIGKGVLIIVRDHKHAGTHIAQTGFQVGVEFPGLPVYLHGFFVKPGKQALF